MTDFIDNYDELTVDEVAARLEDRTASELDAVRQYEERNKDRVTLLDVIEQRQHGLGGDDGESDREEATDSPRSLSDPSKTDGDGDDAEAPGAEPENPADEEPDSRSERPARDELTGPSPGDTVTVRYGGSGPHHVAGLWFDNGPTQRAVTYTRRIQHAVANDELTLVSD